MASNSGSERICRKARIFSWVSGGSSVGVERFRPGLLVLIDRAQNAPGLIAVQPYAAEKIKPQIAVAEPHVKIAVGQAEAGKALNQQRDQLDFGFGPRLAEDVGIKLKKAPAAAFLHPLITVELSNAKPLDRPFERARPFSHQSANGRRHFRSQRDLAAAFVRETEELIFDLFSRLGSVEIEGLQHGSVVLGEAKSARGAAP